MYTGQDMEEQSNRVPCKYLLTTHRCGERPYGQPGQLPTGGALPPLLIELKAQIYKLVTL